MQNKNLLLNIILGVACAFFIIFTFSSFNRVKKMEFDFNEKKATLVKESLDLKDRLESLEEIVKQKTSEAAGLEEKRKAVEEELKQLKGESEKLNSDYTQLNQKYENLMLEKKLITDESEVLKNKYIALSQKVEALEKNPLIQKIQESIDKEQNSEIKKVLQAALANIQLIQAGKSVDLTPIVVVGKDREASGIFPLPGGQQAQTAGGVLSVDKKNNLVVIDLGRKDKIKEGDKCIIFKDNKELARGEIISVRYKISAVFINEVKYKNVITDIEEGDKVLISNE